MAASSDPHLRWRSITPAPGRWRTTGQRPRRQPGLTPSMPLATPPAAPHAAALQRHQPPPAYFAYFFFDAASATGSSSLAAAAAASSAVRAGTPQAASTASIILPSVRQLMQNVFCPQPIARARTSSA
jgi:hypothetical protein